MITIIVSDFSRVILFPQDTSYTGSLNDLNRKLTEEKGESYDFFKYFKLDEDILTLYKDLKDKHEIYIFTSDSIQNRPEIRRELDPLVSDMLSAKAHNLDKSDPAAYTFIAHKLQKPLETFLYIDDQKNHVEAAKKAGMQGIHYQNIDQLKEALTALNM